MDAETHPDPLREAMNHGLQRALQVTSFAGTAAQAYLYYQKTHARAAAEQDARVRRALLAQVRTEQEASRAGWSPALDPQWLRSASLHDTAQTWGAAMPHADRDVPWYEPTAATALRKSEERLRDLHPFAMARYDRLRTDGLGPAEAMREAAPLFALRPRARNWPYTPRPVLDAGTGADPWSAADLPAPGSGPDDLPGQEMLALRGQGIIAALQERARAEGREPLGPDELRTVLETITNLPADVIDRVAGSAPAKRPAQAEAAATSIAAGRASRAAQPWDRDFPVPIDQVVAAAAAGPAAAAAPRAGAARPAASRAARPGGPGHA